MHSTLIVKSALDDGFAGTLRAALAAAHNGDTIKFAPALDGQTVTLTQGQLVVNQSVAIAGPGASELTISGDASSRLFEIGSAARAGRARGVGFFYSPAGDGGPDTLSVSSSAILANAAEGGAGATGGNGGDALGGGIFNDLGATATVMASVITANLAHCGLAGAGGSVGQGIGGGIYNLGTFSLDTLTVVLGNDASTSNDNKFGV